MFEIAWSFLPTAMSLSSVSAEPTEPDQPHVFRILLLYGCFLESPVHKVVGVWTQDQNCTSEGPGEDALSPGFLTQQV